MTAPHVRVHTEDNHSIWLMQWCRFTRIEGDDIQSPAHVADYIFHTPNGGLRSGTEAARFKAMGVRAGIPDYFLPVARQGFHGLWIELKRPREPGNNPTVTDKQHAWISRMQKAGYEARICYGWREAAEVLAAYLGVPNVAS